MMSTLPELNDAPGDEALQALMACVGSRNWAERLLLRRPFQSIDSLLEHARVGSEGSPTVIGSTLFRAILGSVSASAKALTGARGWSDQEQAGAREAQTATTMALREANIDLRTALRVYVYRLRHWQDR
jgi:hypothetical protein